ncbi:choice-of-anchor Q domain-containing protein [Desulfococcaceae bacterium HSG8]|nr:choice-of-anchor Q domain-containing protein [Desulfococcaceae bacterium HSG8]
MTNGNDSGEGSLRKAIADASGGDTIIFQGVVTVTLTTDQLVINKYLIIDGGSGVTVQRSSSPDTPDFRIFYINGGVRMKSLTITRGQASEGESGGGIFAYMSRITLENVTVNANSAGYDGNGGGIYYSINSDEYYSDNYYSQCMESFELTLKNSTVSGNRAGTGGNGGNGGGIYAANLDSPAYHEASYDWPELDCSGDELILDNSIVQNNAAGAMGHGGGIYIVGGIFTLENSTVSKNMSGSGYYDFFGGGDVCYDGGDGGGIYISDAEVMLRSSTVDNNGAGSGESGLVYVNGSLGGSGGGIYLSSGILTLENSTVSNNSAGAGADASAMADGGGGGSGGGIYLSSGTLTLENSTVSSNSAGAGGKGDVSGTPGAVVPIDGDGGSGGGIYVDSGMLVLGNSTVSDNSAGVRARDGSWNLAEDGSGGGIYIKAGTVSARNTILAANAVKESGKGPDCMGIFISEDYNIIENMSECNFQQRPNDQITDPLVKPLADNGGPTWTHALEVSSPAIDAGSCTTIDGKPLVSTDQRGISRPHPAGGSCDIGAYEHEQIPPNAPANLSLSSEDDTGTSNSDAVTQKTSDLTITGTGEDGLTVHLYNNGSSIPDKTATVSGSIFSIDISLTEGIHSIAAKQTDVFGNPSELSSPLTITVDTTAPFGSLTIKDNNGYTNDSALELTLSSDGAVSMRIGLTESALSSAIWLPYVESYDSFDISQGGDGEKWILAQFQDAAGNIRISPASDSTVYDTTPPGRPNITGTAPTNDTTPEWRWMSGGDGNGTYRYKLDNSNLGTGATETASTEYTSDTPLSEGYHTFYVQERDIVGNWSDSGSFTIEIDKSASPPPVFLDTTTFSPANNTRPTWKWTSGGGNKIYQYRLGENEAWSSDTEITEYTSGDSLSDGDRTLYVREKDVSDNWSSAASRTIVIDTGKPCSEAAAPSAVGAQERTFTITYSYNDIYEKEDCGAASSGSGTEKIELYVETPGSSVYTLADTDTGASADKGFEYTVTDEGAYYFYTIATDKADNTEEPPEEYDAKTVYGSQFAGYALLAVGSVANNEGIESHTLTANTVYRHLISRGFALVEDSAERWNDPLDNIKYFNPYNEVQTGEDDYTEYGSYWMAMRKAITTWAPEKMRTNPAPLYIILINHGSPDRFHLTATESFYAGELAGWLDTLESAMASEGTDQPVVVILGTCYSGSFADDLSGPGRIIVTSASADELSYAGASDPGGTDDGEFFISALFGALGQGSDLKTGFESAVQQTEAYTYTGKDDELHHEYNDTAMQHPLLDDNGDGTGSNDLTLVGSRDGDTAKNIVLGYGSADELPPVLITSAGKEPAVSLSGTDEALLWAKVNDEDRVKSIWVEIREPGLILEGSGTQQAAIQQTVNLISRPLARNNDEKRYEVTYPGFSEPGRYILFFYVRDNDDIISPFEKAYLYRQSDDSPVIGGDINGDGSADLRDSVLGLRIVCDADVNGEIIITETGVETDGNIGLEDVIFILQKVAGL